LLYLPIVVLLAPRHAFRAWPDVSMRTLEGRMKLDQR